MAFKYRLETSLRLAQQELDIAQSLLAVEMRILQTIRQERDSRAELFEQAIEGQKHACLGEPQQLSLWQKYQEVQKENLAKCEQEVLRQEQVTTGLREKLIQSRINLEKFKRLKHKKWKLYDIDELRKEQAIIDEIPQSRLGRG